jgi:uncharacterized protein
MNMIKGVAILLWASDTERPQLLATPFFHASAAAAMDLETEVYFAARSVHVLVRGVADHLHASHHPKTILATMKEARGHGAKFFVCSDALAAQRLDGHGGAVQFMARVIDPAWRTLVF